MTGESIATKYGSESRPSRTHQHLLHPSKTDEIEVLESGVINHHNNIGSGITNHRRTKVTAGWICCMPCVWLRTSATVHKIALTTATLLVTSLLVASPVLFLLSTAPSQLPKDCNTKSDANCVTRTTPSTECSTTTCRQAMINIQARTNWKIDPCQDFKSFSCATSKNNAKTVKSIQEGVDALMQQLLRYNTTTGTFRKLGLLYESCLRQSINSTGVRKQMQQIGSYMPSTVTGPQTIGGLILKLNDFGPTPLISIYYDMSYGRKSQPMIIIDSSMELAPALQNPIRWLAPKAAPFNVKYDVPPLLDTLIEMFLPTTLEADRRELERDTIVNFIKELNQLRRESLRRGFTDSYVLYNVSTLSVTYPFLYWDNLVYPPKWSGPILIRGGSSYLKSIDQLISRHSTRVAHNALIVLFTLGLLPENVPTPEICTKATMWAMPEVSSALFTSQYSDDIVNDMVQRTEIIFEVLKSHLKRAPSLKGNALVKLSQLKVNANNWPALKDLGKIDQILQQVDITDNWMVNILNIYKLYSLERTNVTLAVNDVVQNAPDCRWPYPTIARVFYDTLSHSIVVPLSVLLTPYFDASLPSYLHYASVGVAIGKEILRSITRGFDAKVMGCVPSSVNVFSNSSRMDLLLHSGGMQMAYHSMLSLSGPIKGMLRLPNMNLQPTQIFYLVTAQEMCANALYAGVDVSSDNFGDILSWLISQGGNAPNVFQCSQNSPLNSRKTCNVL